MRVGEPRQSKAALVSEVQEKFASSSAVFVTEYRGLKVQDLERLRRDLKEVGAEYKVFKNTLVRLGASQAGYAALTDFLLGPTGLVFAFDDIALTARRLRDFARSNDLLVIKGGMLGGEVLDQGATLALANLPSREVLLAQIAGAMAAPMANFASLLQALPRNLAYGIKALIDERDAA